MKKLTPKNIQFTTKTRQQIAEEYGIHRSTLDRKLKKLNIQLPRGTIMPKDIKRIYEALGWPEMYSKG